MISNIYLINMSFIHRSHDFTFEEYINQNFQSQLNDHCPAGISIKSVSWVNDGIVSSLLNLEATVYKKHAESLLDAMSLSIGYIHIQVEGPECLERQKLDWLEWVYQQTFKEFFYACSYCFYLVNSNKTIMFEMIKGFNSPNQMSSEDDYTGDKIQDFAELMNHYFYDNEIPDYCADKMAMLVLNQNLDALEVR